MYSLFISLFSKILMTRKFYFPVRTWTRPQSCKLITSLVGMKPILSSLYIRLLRSKSNDPIFVTHIWKTAMVLINTSAVNVRDDQEPTKWRWQSNYGNPEHHALKVVAKHTIKGNSWHYLCSETSNTPILEYSLRGRQGYLVTALLNKIYNVAIKRGRMEKGSSHW